MSKIGKNPVEITQGANLEIKEDVVSIKGPKGVLTVDIPKNIKVTVKEGKAVVERENESIRAKSLHGTVRTLIANAVHGVTK